MAAPVVNIKRLIATDVVISTPAHTVLAGLHPLILFSDIIVGANKSKKIPTRKEIFIQYIVGNTTHRSAQTNRWLQ